MFVGITTHTIYGTSGNELPPPIMKRTKTAQILDVDTYKEAMDLMAVKVLLLRRAAEKHCEPYSSPDGYEWEAVLIV